MKHIRLLLPTLSLFVISSAQAIGGPPTITVTPSLAPNAFGSPNWAGYVGNAVTALYNGFSTFGSPSSPDYYAAVTGPINVKDNIVTGFNSWHGDANPGVDFGAPFAGEYGNRLHFGVVINGHGTQFAIADLAFDAVSSDPLNGLGFSFSAGSFNYSSSYMGVIHGPSGDTFVTSGPNTQLVDELVGRGSGNAYAVYDTDPGATEQDKIDQAAANIGYYSFTGTYTLDGGSGSATVNAVPEPMSLTALGLGALAFLRKRRR